MGKAYGPHAFQFALLLPHSHQKYGTEMGDFNNYDGSDRKGQNFDLGNINLGNFYKIYTTHGTSCYRTMQKNNKMARITTGNISTLRQFLQDQDIPDHLASHLDTWALLIDHIDDNFDVHSFQLACAPGEIDALLRRSNIALREPLLAVRRRCALHTQMQLDDELGEGGVRLPSHDSASADEAADDRGARRRRPRGGRGRHSRRGGRDPGTCNGTYLAGAWRERDRDGDVPAGIAAGRGQLLARDGHGPRDGGRGGGAMRGDSGHHAHGDQSPGGRGTTTRPAAAPRVTPAAIDAPLPHCARTTRDTDLIGLDPRARTTRDTDRILWLVGVDPDAH
eukprot:gene41150-64336_t